MNEENVNRLTCELCNNPVKDDDDFCPFCGIIFIDDIYCQNHNDILANGVCIICYSPFCKKCGAKLNNIFLCNEHSNYEIYEGMARVYITYDETDALFVKSCLEQDGLHPVLFYRHSPYGGSGIAFGLFEVSGSNIKVMVPCQEVLKAEQVIKSININ